jgi:hypothetical protein
MRFTVCFFFAESPAGFRGAFGCARDADMNLNRGARGAMTGAGGADGAMVAEAPVTSVEPDGAANITGAAI